MTKIRMLHRNMLYQLKMVQDDGAQQDTLVEHVNIQLATANQLMYEHFYSPWYVLEERGGTRAEGLLFLILLKCP